MVHTAPEGHINVCGGGGGSYVDVCESCCHQRPRWCLCSVLLSESLLLFVVHFPAGGQMDVLAWAVIMVSMVHSSADNCVDVCGLYCHRRPY